MSLVENESKKPSMVGIFSSPIVQLERIKERPLVLIPLLVVLAISIIGSAILAFIPDYSSMTELMIQQEPATGEMIEVLEVMSRVIVLIAGIFTPVLLAILPAFIFWLVAKITGSMVTYKQLVSLMLYISLIAAIGYLFNAVVVALFNLEPTVIVTGIGQFFDSMEPMYSFYSLVDIFTIWYVILTALGLRYVAGFNNGLAWSLPILYSVGSALIGYLSTLAAI